MSDLLTVRVSGLSGSITLEDLPAGSTVADAREAAGVDEGLSIRSNGETVSNDAPLVDDQVLVSVAPAAKHGVVIAA